MRTLIAILISLFFIAPVHAARYLGALEGSEGQTTLLRLGPNENVAQLCNFLSEKLGTAVVCNLDPQDHDNKLVIVKAPTADVLKWIAKDTVTELTTPLSSPPPLVKPAEERGFDVNGVINTLRGQIEELEKQKTLLSRERDEWKKLVETTAPSIPPFIWIIVGAGAALVWLLTGLMVARHYRKKRNEMVSRHIQVLGDKEQVYEAAAARLHDQLNRRDTTLAQERDEHERAVRKLEQQHAFLRNTHESLVETSSARNREHRAQLLEFEQALRKRAARVAELEIENEKLKAFVMKPGGKLTWVIPQERFETAKEIAEPLRSISMTLIGAMPEGWIDGVHGVGPWYVPTICADDQRMGNPRLWVSSLEELLEKDPTAVRCLEKNAGAKLKAPPPTPM